MQIILFPTVEERLKMKIPITREFTAIVTGHGKTKSYMHRFKLTDNPMCPCSEGEQPPEHLIYECKILEFQRSSLKQHNGWRRGLVYHQQQSGSQIFKCLFTICQIYRFQQTAIDYTMTCIALTGYI